MSKKYKEFMARTDECDNVHKIMHDRGRMAIDIYDCVDDLCEEFYTLLITKQQAMDFFGLVEPAKGE